MATKRYNFVGWVLIPVLCFMAMPATAATFGNFTYTSPAYSDNGTFITITDYPTSAVGEVVIPATIAGKPVTAIGRNAFKTCGGITSVTIPFGVTSIEEGAFSCCSGLTRVTIPASMTSIGAQAFYKCSRLTSVTIPSSVTSIGFQAFYWCSGLTSVTIPSSGTSIERDAFEGCIRPTILHALDRDCQKNIESTPQSKASGARPAQMNKGFIEGTTQSKASDRQRPDIKADKISSRVKNEASQLGEIKIVPQTDWHRTTGQEMQKCEELYKVLKPVTEPDSTLEVSSYPEIYKGVRLMMPLTEALKLLNLDKNLIPAKSPISHAGIPFYFRPFDWQKHHSKFEKSLEEDGAFNLLYVITDWADKVVGILLVCETPRISVLPNTEFFTYNFVLNRYRIANTLKVRCELARGGRTYSEQTNSFSINIYPSQKASSSDSLIVKTWLINLETNPNCLEIDQWFLPSKVANFIRYVLEIKLGIRSDKLSE